MRHIQRTRRECMMLLLDTKPRFRAENEQWHRLGGRWKYGSRRPAHHRYTDWEAGPILPNSCVVDLHDPHPFRGLWDTDSYGNEIAIMQSEDPDDWRTMLKLTKDLVDKKVKREKLIIVDEGLDFYQRNTLGIDSRNDVILRTARSGGERRIGLMFGAHRPHGIPPLLNTLTSRVTLFHLTYSRDMTYLWEMGIPQEERSPQGNYVFRQYERQPGGTISDPITAKLNLPESYLAQLSSS